MTKSANAALLTIFQPTAAQIDRFRMAVSLRPARTKTEILVADTNENSRQLLYDMLRKDVLPNTSKLYQAANAKEAWSVYLSYAPDIVFLGVDLPEVNGYCLTKLIRAIDPSVAAVLIAKQTSSDDAKKLKECDAKGLLMHPYDIQKVTAIVQRIVQQKKGASTKKK